MSLLLPSVSDLTAHLGLEQAISEQLIDYYGSISSKEELFQWIQQVGIEGSKVDVAADLVADLEERINLVQHKLKFIEEEQKPSVLVLSGVVPLVIEKNNYLKEILEIAGSKLYDIEMAGLGQALNPDIVLIISDHMESLFSQVGGLLSTEEWQSTHAVKKNRVYLINGEHNFMGYGSRIADDLEILAEIIYPHYLTFGGNGETWVQFEL